MKKIDLKENLKSLYQPTAKQVVMVTVPKMNFLMLDGVGNPNTAPAYQDALAALYAVAFTLKFMFKLKLKPAIDYPVMPLEGLWWVDRVSEFSLAALMDNKDAWQWTMMIMQPECVTRAHVKQAMAEAQRKKDLPALPKLRFEAFAEGKCAQVLHLGPYSAEQPNITRLHQFIHESGHALRGKHHEIYLSDPRRAQPEKMKTVLRQPFK